MEKPTSVGAGAPVSEPRIGYLGLGSNLGEREHAIRRALELLAEGDVEVQAVSSLYETEPVGEILDQPDFLNAVARIRTALEPEALLDGCKAIEVELGRVFAGPRHGPRPIDVDLLLLGDVQLESERLVLPHRDLANRRFVLIPLLELDPALALPDGTELSERLRALGDSERVERVGSLPAGRGTRLG